MGYLPLDDYGVIGNLSCAALVSRLGSIDWCCMPYLDSPSHFAAIVDENQGGRFQISPAGDFRSEQNYLSRSNVLETLFETPTGKGVVRDWMPMESQLPVLCRTVEVFSGKIQWQMLCSPRFNYGAHSAQSEKFKGGILFRGTDPEHLAELHSKIPLVISMNGSAASAEFTLSANENAEFVWAWGRTGQQAGFPDSKPSLEIWRTWSHRCPNGESVCLFAGPWHDVIVRSEIALRTLFSPFSGSIAEAVFSRRDLKNWDHRRAWIRDAALTYQALSCIGWQKEAQNFFTWLSDIVIRDGPEGLQPAYSLDGGRFQMPHRFSLDIFGHVLSAASVFFKNTGALPKGLWDRLVDIVEYVCQAWKRPDYGSWGDISSKPDHYVVSKVHCWTALENGIFLAEKNQTQIPARWIQEREILRKTICDQGFDKVRGIFVRSFGSNDYDSNFLMIPFLGFLAFDDPRIQNTMNHIQAELSDGVLIRHHHNNVVQGGNPNADLQSSLMFIICLALSGRSDEATDRLAELCTYATSLGYFGTHVNPITSETLGHFPSATSHIALINAAIYVGAVRGRIPALTHLLGFPEPIPLRRPRVKIA